MEARKSFVEYHSVPGSLVDTLGRIICEIPSRLITGEIKPSARWTWEKQSPVPADFRGYFLDGDKNAFTPRNYFDMVKARTRWGWRTMRTMEVNQVLLSGDQRNIDYWLYAYAPEDRSYIDICHTAISPSEVIKIKIGPEPLFYFGIGSDGKEVPLSISGPFTSKNYKFKKIPLF